MKLKPWLFKISKMVLVVPSVSAYLLPRSIASSTLEMSAPRMNFGNAPFAPPAGTLVAPPLVEPPSAPPPVALFEEFLPLVPPACVDLSPLVPPAEVDAATPPVPVRGLFVALPPAPPALFLPPPTAAEFDAPPRSSSLRLEPPVALG